MLALMLFEPASGKAKAADRKAKRQSSKKKK